MEKEIDDKGISITETFGEILDMAVIGYRSLALELNSKAESLQKSLEAGTRRMEELTIPEKVQTDKKVKKVNKKAPAAKPSLVLRKPAVSKKAGRKLSVAGRERIREAQKKRWALIRKQNKPVAAA